MPPDSRVAFGPFVLDAVERRLTRDGQPVPLAPRPFDVLVVLVAHDGRLVTKDALMETVWNGAVVEDNALTVAVSKLRAALGPDGAACIETVARHGYRFVGWPPSEASPAEARADVSPMIAAPALLRLPAIRWGVALAVVTLGAVWAVGGARAPDSPASSRVPAGVVASVDAPTVPETAARAAAVAAVERGRDLWATRRQWAEAYEQFRLAVGRDSTYAPGYVGLADTYALQYRTADEAEAALARALALDPDLADAHATLGFVRAMQRWDWAGAEASLAHALDLEPGHSQALQWLAVVRMIGRRPDEAEALLQRALAGTPRSASLWSDLCEVRLTARRLSDAEVACQRALDLDPAFPFARQHLFWIAWLDGRPADALRDAARGRPQEPHRPPPDALAAEGGRAYLQWWLARRESDGAGTAYERARHLALAGETDAALDALARAVEEREFLAPFAHADPTFGSLRSAPRFRTLMVRMGLG